jgi:VWFA-related protein
MRTSVALVPLLVAAGLAAAAQTPPPAGEPQPLDTFGEVLEVRVVNLEVVVTDADGNRVHGLRRSDFRLLDGEREMPIDYFTEVREGQAVAAVPAAEGTPQPPAAPSLAESGPVATSYLVFVDDLFSLRTRRGEVLRGLQIDLARLGPEDRMAVVAFDGRRLESLSSWTGSREELRRALEVAAARRAHGIQRAAELASMEASRRMADASLPRAWRELDSDQLAYARQVNDRIERSVTAVVSAMRAFAKAPGRKVLLLLAGGWPSSPVAYTGNTLEPIWDPRVPWSRDLYAPLTDTANRLGFTVYPVDVPGLEPAGPDATTADSTVELLDVRETVIHGALDAIAAGTGGRALINEARRAALDSAHADTRSYYWLGFSPAWRGDDHRHRVRVQVLREGLRARSRASVLDLSPGSEVSMMLEHTLLFGGGTSTATMDIELGKPERTRRNEMEIPISLRIPLASFMTLPAGGKWIADLELHVGAMDDRGDRSAIPIIPLHFPFDRQPPATGGHVRYDTRLALRRIQQHLVLALFDPLSGKVTTAEADVEP